MSQSPEEIRAEIDNTRNRLGTNVDAVADKVSPSAIAHRQSEKVKDRLGNVKDKIMGATDNATGNVSDTVHDAKDNVSGAVQNLPHQVTGKTQGNPLAAGLIAFAAGWLVSSMIPASSVEKQAAGQLKDQAQPLIHKVTEAAGEVGEHMKEPLQQAVNEVKESAKGSAQTVKEEGTQAVSDVKDRAQEAGQTVKDQAT